jgi:pimeloyl-ACP methyl ester carboxylesterase
MQNLESAKPRSNVTAIQERWVGLSQGRVRYLTGGSGPPLVLVHGLLGYSFSWRFNLEPLARRFTVFAPDFPGAGLSAYPPDCEGSLQKTAEVLQEFISSLGVEECDIIASSHGGATALMWAAGGQNDHAPAARRMLLSAPVNPWSSTRRLLIPLLGSRGGAALFRRCAPHLAFTHPYWLGRLYGECRSISPETIAGYSAPLELPHGYDRALSLLRTWRADLLQLERVLPRMRVPTLLVWGTRDRAVLPSSAERLRSALHNARLVWLEGAGHLPYEECPEEFNRIALEFLG